MDDQNVPLEFQYELRNMLQNFLINDEMRVLEFPEMILMQMEHIHNLIRQLTTELGAEYKIYAPLWEAMRIFSLKYIFKVSIHTIEDTGRGNLTIEKIPRKKQRNHEQDTQDSEVSQSTDTEGNDDETSDSSRSSQESPIHFPMPDTKKSIQTAKRKKKKLNKNDKFVIHINKVITTLSSAALEKLLHKILDFLIKEDEGSLVFTDLTPLEARFVENFLGIYNRRQHFRSSLSSACVALLDKIKEKLTQFDKLCKLEVTAKYNVHTKHREVTFLKAPRFSRNSSHQTLKCNFPQKTPKIESSKYIGSQTIVNSNHQLSTSVKDKEICEVESHVNIPSSEDKDPKIGEKEKLSMTTELPEESGQIELHVNTCNTNNKDFMSTEKEKLAMTTKVPGDSNNNRKWSLDADFKDFTNDLKEFLSDGEKGNEFLDVVIQDCIQRFNEKILSLDSEAPRVSTDNREEPYNDAMDDKDDFEEKLSVDAYIIKDNEKNIDSFEENSINPGTINKKDATDKNDIENKDDTEEELSMEINEKNDKIMNNLQIAEDKLIVPNKALLKREIVEIAVPKDRKSTSPVGKSCAQIDKLSVTNSDRFRSRPLCAAARREKLLQDMSTPLESDKAMRMMRLMGWEGGALGPRGEGLIEPIIPALDLVSRKGLGHTKGNRPFTALAAEKPKTTHKATEKPQLMKPKNPTILTPVENRTDFLKTLLLVLNSEDTCVSTISYKGPLRQRDKRCYDNIIRMLNLRVHFTLSEVESALLTNIRIVMAARREVTLYTTFNSDLTEIKISKTQDHEFVTISDEESLQLSQAHESIAHSDEKRCQPSQAHESISHSDEKRCQPPQSHKSIINCYENWRSQLSEKKKKPKIVTIKNFFKKNQFKTHICNQVLDFLRTKNSKTVVKFGASLTKKYCKIVGNVCKCVNDRVMICHKNVRDEFTQILDLVIRKEYMLDIEFGTDLRSIILRKSVGKPERRRINGDVLKHLINKFTDCTIQDVDNSTDKPINSANNNRQEEPNNSNAQVDIIESKKTLNKIINPSIEEERKEQINPENDLHSYNTVSYTFIDSVETSVIDDKTLIENDVFFTNEFSKCIKTRKRKGSKEQNVQKPIGNVLPLYVKDIVNAKTSDCDDFRRIDKDLIKDILDSLISHKENFEIESSIKKNNDSLETENLECGETSKINNGLYDLHKVTNIEKSREWYKRSEKFLISEDLLEIDKKNKVDPNNNENRINSRNIIQDCVDTKVNTATDLTNNRFEALKSDSEIVINLAQTSNESDENCLVVVEELGSFDKGGTKSETLQTGAASNYDRDGDIMNSHQINEKPFEICKIKTEVNSDEDFCVNKDIYVNKPKLNYQFEESCSKVSDTNKKDLSCHRSDRSEEYVQSDRDVTVDNIEVVKNSKDNLGHLSKKEYELKNTIMFSESELIDLNINLEADLNLTEETICGKNNEGPHQNDKRVEIESDLKSDLTCVCNNDTESCTESQNTIKNDSELKTIKAEYKVKEYEDIIETNSKLNIIHANNVEEVYSFTNNDGVEESKDPLKSIYHQDIENENGTINNIDELNIDNNKDLRQGNEKRDDSNTGKIKNCQEIFLIESNILEVELIQKKLQDLIGNSSENEFLPCLKYHGVLDTGIVYGCLNKGTSLWLKLVLSEYSVVDYKCATDNYKLKIKVASLNKDSKAFFYLLELYNEGLKCNNWKVVSEKHYNYCLQMFVEMDIVSFEFVYDNNFSLSVGYDVAQFSIGW